MSLSTRIVQRGVATVGEVDEALARQILYGGDLVTNLLEVGRVDEGVLMPIVAEELGLPSAPIGELPRASSEAQRMVAPEVALERAMAPLTMDRDGLVIAVAEPLAKDDEQELAFALAMPIAQQIAPLVRIRQALARDYGVPLDRRLERLLLRIDDKGPKAKSSAPPQPAPAPKAPPRPPSVQPFRASPAIEPPRVLAAGTPATLLRDVDAPPARPTKRRRGPLTMEVAATELEAAPDRDGILDLLFEYARQYFDYTALFLVKDDLAEGRDAFGAGSPRDVLVRIGVPLDMPSLFASARDQKKLVRGMGNASGVDGVLAKDLARSGTTEWVVIPVVVRGRVVALLVGDSGDGGIDDSGLRDVTEVTTLAAASFERVIVRRKLVGSAPPPRAPGFSSRPPRPAPPPPSQTPDTQHSAESKRPSVEELAAPIRELANEIQRPPSAPPKASVRPPVPLWPGSTPPPPNVVSVRRPAGAPIPREEPEASEASAPPEMSLPPRTKSSSTHRRAVAPTLDFGSRPPPPIVSTPPPTPRAVAPTFKLSPPVITSTINTAVTEPPPPAPPRPVVPAPTVVSEAPTSPKAQSPLPPRPSRTTDVSPGNPFLPPPARTLEIIEEDAQGTPLVPTDVTPIAPSVEAGTPAPAPVRVTSSLVASPVVAPKPMPASEQQISVAPHRPPTSRRDSERGLPSIIVDTTSEFAEYVTRALKGDDDEAEAQLLRGGGAAMPAIMEKFPGPITVADEALEGVLPRVAECGPLVRLVAAQRRTAVPYVLALVDSDDVDKRFWATYLITELVYADAIDAVVRRLFDEVSRVRRAARAAARGLAEAHPAVIVERLTPTAQDKLGKKAERVLAIEALGETRQPLAVPALVPLVSDRSPEITAAARTALRSLARQDFASDAKKWESWWAQNKDRHRIEWLIDALTHPQSGIRAAAGEELKAISREFLTYHDDLPRKDREKAQARYRDWWSSVGRVRFNRSSPRG